MTYEDERGVAGRLAADDEYGTPPESYGGQQYEPMAPDRGDERGEPGQDWQGVPAPEAQGARDAEEFEYWPSAEAPAGFPSAGRPPAEVAAALDYGAGTGARPRPGGLHAPLPAGENAYVDWIKGLGTEDAGHEEWATADPHAFDPDDEEGHDEGDEEDSAEEWQDGDDAGPDTGGKPGTPAGEWTPAAEQAAGPGAAQEENAQEENWFEPKQRPDQDGPGDAEQFAPAQPVAGTGLSPVEENWFEPKSRNDGPNYALPAIAAHSAAPIAAPPPYQTGADWPRSAEELDFVTPEQASGGAGFGAVEYRGADYRSADYPPTEYRGGGYENGGHESDGYENGPGYGHDGGGYGHPAADYPGGYGDDRPGEYAAGGYDGSYDEGPDDRAARNPGDDAPTTMLMLGGTRKPATDQRRKTRSYRPLAIAAGVVVAATVGVVGVALHDTSAQSANPGPPVSTGNPAPPPTDTGSPAGLLPPPDDSATASPPPPTTGSRPTRTTAAPHPTQKHHASPTPPPTHRPTPPPTHTATPTPTATTDTPTPTPTDTSGTGANG